MIDCPFDTRLNRTPYLVIPKLALQAMPLEWRRRFEKLLEEADEAGLETPEYTVFRDVTRGNSESVRGCKQVNPDDWSQRPFYRLTGGNQGDPWADYRHGDVSALCPRWKAPV